MTSRTPPPPGAALVGDDALLRHVLVVGGTSDEWEAMSPDEWSQRIEQLGSFCAALGVAWLTVRVYELDGGDTAADRSMRPAIRHEVAGCTVTVDPFGNGQERFAEAMRRIAPDADINEKTVAAALYAPAEDEPDLVVVLGPQTQLPPSLVWELAYAELVFVPVAWADLTTSVLAGAVADFSHRSRRFGGLDPD